MIELAYNQFSDIIPYLFILFLGFLVGKSKIIDASSLKTIGNVTINYLTPFVVIDMLQIQKTPENSSNILWGILSAIIIFLLFYIIAFFFFLKKRKDSSNIYAASLCSSSAAILAYPLILNISQENARIYTAIFIMMNQLMFNVLMGKFFYKKRSLLKRIITIPLMMSLFGVLMYFCNVKLILPIGNTVSYIASIVPTLSAIIIGIYFSLFTLEGFKLQLDAIIVSAFKLLLLPILTFGICLFVNLSLETTLIFVILSGLPCGIELECITSLSQGKNIPCAANITAITFVFSCISIPVISYIVFGVYSMLKF